MNIIHGMVLLYLLLCCYIKQWFTCTQLKNTALYVILHFQLIVHTKITANKQANKKIKLSVVEWLCALVYHKAVHCGVTALCVD